MYSHFDLDFEEKNSEELEDFPNGQKYALNDGGAHINCLDSIRINW